MSYFDSYEYSEPSELDQLVDDTTDKIKNLIVAETKEKVDTILNSAKVAERRLDIAYNRLREANEEISSLTKENKKLKEELEQKRTSLNTLPFEIGQKVYYLKKWTYEEVTCPSCKGTGKVTTHSDEYGDVEIRCPNCKDNSYWSDKEKLLVRKTSYPIFKVSDTTVKGFIMHIESDEQGNVEQKVKVMLNNHYGYDPQDVEDIFTEAQLAECKKECAKRNRLYKEEAERKVGILNDTAK